MPSFADTTYTRSFAPYPTAGLIGSARTPKTRGLQPDMFMFSAVILEDLGLHPTVCQMQNKVRVS